MADPITLNVNGAERTRRAPSPTRPLLYVLRNDLGLKGTRFGCGSGECGACNVLIDGRAVPSCDTPLWTAAGKDITTVEGLGRASALHPLQQAFIDEQAAQCGYCVKRHHDERRRAACKQSGTDRRRNPRGARQEPVPLRHAHTASCARCSARRPKRHERRDERAAPLPAQSQGQSAPVAVAALRCATAR